MSVLKKYIAEKYFIVQRYLTISGNVSSIVSIVDATPAEFLSYISCVINYYDISTSAFVSSAVTDGSKLMEYLNGGIKCINLVDTSNGSKYPLYLYTTHWTSSISNADSILYIDPDSRWQLGITLDGNTPHISLYQGAAPADLNNWYCWNCGNSWYERPSPNYPTICPSCGSDDIMVPNIDAQCDECGTLFSSTIYGECPNCGYDMYTYIDTTGPWVCYDCGFGWDSPEGHNPSICPRCGSDNIDYDGE